MGLTFDAVDLRSRIPSQLRLGALSACLWAGCLGLLWTLPAGAANPVTLDLEALLSDDDVRDGRIEDDVWQVQGQPGRTLMALPLVLTGPVDEELELRQSPVEISGARFIGFWLRPEEGANRAPSSSPRSNVARVGDSRRVLLNNDAGGPGGRSDVAEAEDFPEGAPRIMRRLTLKPAPTSVQQPRLGFKLDRTIPGAELKSGDTDYLLLLDRSRLEDKLPDRPDRPAPSANASREQRLQANRTYQDQLRQYREDQLAYRELRTRVLGLEEEFELPAPNRWFAIYEYSSQYRSLTFRFADGSQPDWEIPVQTLQAARSTLGGTRNGGATSNRNAGPGGLNPDLNTALSQLDTLVQKGHPLSAAFAARAIAISGVLGSEVSGGPGEQLALRLVRGDQAEARSTVAQAAVLVLPPTAVSAEVVSAAAEREGGRLKGAAIRSWLSVEASGAGGVNAALNRANQELRDPQGAEPALVLEALLETLEGPLNPQANATSRNIGRGILPSASRGAGVDLGDTEQQLAINGLDFSAIPSGRQSAALQYVVTAAPLSEIAAGWLDRRLLQSPDSAIVRATLLALARTEDDHAMLTPAMTGLKQLVFDVDPQAAESSPPRGITGSIPLTSSNHGLLRSLRSQDPDMRSLAWQALRHFSLTDRGSGSRSNNRRASGPGATDGEDLFMNIVTDGLAQKPTPSGLIGFMDQQTDSSRGTAALVQAALLGDAAASAQAVRRLYGQDRPVQAAMMALEPDQRRQFVDRVHQTLAGQSPRVAGLIREGAGSSSRAVTWFATQLAEGRLPEPKQWVDAFSRDDKALVELATQSDTDLAQAAFVALGYLAGADSELAHTMSDRGMQLVPRGSDEVLGFWLESRQTIYAMRIEASQGAYRWLAYVASPSLDEASSFRATGDIPGRGGRGGQASFSPRESSARPEPPSNTPAIDLGIVNLTVSGQAVNLGIEGLTLNILADDFAIRMEDPQELGNLDHPQLLDLNLDRMTDPLDLRPRDDGRWIGTGRLPDGRELWLILAPER